jgi:MFS family permease
MNPAELRATLSLAAVFALRLFGMFVILPVFALWAEGRPGWTLALAGIALGAYGLTQALLQLPLGWLSDRRGRKPVIYWGLAALAAGSFLCAAGDSPFTVIAGRILQGAGAISATVLAMAADLTRDSQRTKGMAIIGGTIGAAFALSLLLGPLLAHSVGLPGIFALTGLLALGAMAVVRFALPEEAPAAGPRPKVAFAQVLREPELVRLNVGIFALHAVLMAMFLVLPTELVRAGLPAQQQGWVYLGTLVAGFVLALPAFVGPGATHERAVFLAGIATTAVALIVLASNLSSLATLVTALVIFFAGFNVLEAKLPALVSRAAPPGARGAATGVYSSVQFLGAFFGAAAGGTVAQHFGSTVLLLCCLAVTTIWFAAAWNMGEFLPAASPAPRI